MEDGWDPACYERFRAERARPFHDLVAWIRPVHAPRVIDLGCGTGALTALLHQTLEARLTLGLDRSSNMLERSRAARAPGLSFVRGDFAAPPLRGAFDVVFSNAALHWHAGQRALLDRLRGLLRPGGQLLVQVPANHDYVTHTFAAELADEPRFRAALAGYVRESPVLGPVDYARWLHEAGFEDCAVALRVYGHVLPDAAAVVEWVRGTFLKAYEERLSPALYRDFLAAYSAGLLERLGRAAPIFYPFKRILFRGTLAARAAPGSADAARRRS